MKATEQELEAYMAGKLRLVTARKTGQTRLVPAKPRPYDKGVTTPEKRAYWRVWYLKNRERRLAEKRAYYHKNKGKAIVEQGREAKLSAIKTPQEVEMARILLQLPKQTTKSGRRPRGIMTPAQKKLLKRYHNLKYGLEHREEKRAKAREYYHAKKAQLVKKPGLLQRLFGWSLNA